MSLTKIYHLKPKLSTLIFKPLLNPLNPKKEDQKKEKIPKQLFLQ
jgi:hypothetical protein